MSPVQLNLNLQNLKVGDLVTQNEKYASDHKTYGVVVDIDLDSYNVVQVHWLNYGTFWTMGHKVVKVSKNEKV